MKNLQALHTFAIPTKAKNVIKITALEELKQAWQQAQSEHLPFLFLGQGSNVLFLEDFAGIVAINELRGITPHEDEEYHFLHVQGGENWHELVTWSLQQQIYGLENLALIPGCAGSAPIQNIGAYGVEFKDVCDYVDIINLNTNEQLRLTRAQCEFGYRESVFKHQYKDGFIITAIGLKLAKAWKPVLKYGSLAKFATETVSAQQIFDEVCAIRQSKLPDPKIFGNAGSFFKNPVISAQTFAFLQQEYPAIPHYPQADGQVKLAAGWLIEQCQLKGYQLGGAAVHQQQSLVLINKDHASASDVVELAHHVRQCVAIKFDIYLQPEVRFIGAQGEVDSERTIS